MPYNTTVKNNRLQVVADAVAGKTFAAATGTATAGSLVLGTSSLSGSTGLIVSIPLSTTPFSIASGVATLNGVPLSAAATLAGTNTLAKAELRNNSGTVILDGLTVGLSSADVIVDRTSITQGQFVTVTSMTITSP
jgi:hypothetical protein